MKLTVLMLTMFIIANVTSAYVFNLTDGTVINGRIILSNENTLIIEDEKGTKRMVPVSSLRVGNTASGKIILSNENTLIIEDEKGIKRMVPVSSLKVGNTASGKIILNNENTFIIEDEKGIKRIVPAASFKENDSLMNTGNSLKDFSLYFNLGTAGLLSGKMYDFLHSSLTPTPDLVSISLEGGIDWYFLKYIGISLACGYYEIFASSPKVSTLDIGGGFTAKSLLIGRIPFEIFQHNLALRIYTGLTYSTFGYSSAFKSLVEKEAAKTGYIVSWYTGPASGFGFLGGIGLLFEVNPFGFGLDLFVQNKTMKYPEGGDSFDWFEVGMAFRISFDY